MTALVMALVGIVGALIDVALHFLQLSPKEYLTKRLVAFVTLAGCLMMAASLCFAFNWGAAVNTGVITLMAIWSLATGKEVH